MYPVDQLAPELKAAVEAGAHAVLRAPTGSGKSSRVPRMLAQWNVGEVWVIQPRRLAARSLAQWVASELGEQVGDSIGYRVRMESAVSGATRVVFMTPGVALRMLSQGDHWKKVRVLLLDEFHERNAEVDALAALALQFGSDGPAVWIVSATLDPQPLSQWLEQFRPTRVLESQGRMFPVQIAYQASVGADSLPDTMAKAIQEQHRLAQGDILCFLPGVGEIRATQQRLERFLTGKANIRVLALHADLEPQEQAFVLQPAPAGFIHVILATNVAETSLTLPGVRHVIDSGYVRIARYDPLRCLDTLWTVRASERSAVQRAGRAGRVASGTCLRLWSEQDRPPHEEPPELLRLDLSALWLQLFALAVDPSQLPWFTKPDPTRVDAAHALLERLGALVSEKLTRLGSTMAGLPVSPRAARVLCEAHQHGGWDAAAGWVVQQEARTPYEAKHLRQRLDSLLRHPQSGEVPLERILLAGWPDRLASPVAENRWRLSDGRVAEGVAEGDLQLPVCLVLELQETILGNKGPTLRIRSARRIALEWLRETFQERLQEQQDVVWDRSTRRVVGRWCLLLDGQELFAKPMDDNRISRPKAEQILAEKLKAGEIQWKWEEEEEEWLQRTARVAEAFADQGITALTEEDLELVREILVDGCLAASGVENRAVLPLLKEVQGHQVVSFIEKNAPTTVGLSSGRKAKLAYQPDGKVLLSARIGDLVGVKQASLRIGQGRIPILFEILGPNYRPVQRTSDLDGFWTGSYPEIKKDLQRRYPKHPWP